MTHRLEPRQVLLPRPVLRVLGITVVADLERLPVRRVRDQHAEDCARARRGRGEDALLILGRLPLCVDLVQVLAEARLLTPKAEVPSVRLAAGIGELVLLLERQVEEALVLPRGRTRTKVSQDPVRSPARSSRVAPRD